MGESSRALLPIDKIPFNCPFHSVIYFGPSTSQEVQLSYAGKKSFIGSFCTQAHAIMASEVAQAKLKAMNTSSGSAEGSKQHVKFAKESALAAVYEVYGVDASRTNSNERKRKVGTSVEEILCNTDQDGPTLLPGSTQSEKVSDLFCSCISLCYFICSFLIENTWYH